MIHSRNSVGPLRFIIILGLCLLVNPTFFFAQSYEEIGRLPMSTYLSDEYNGNDQVWAAVQSNDGLMYFAHTNGIVEYDGVFWNPVIGSEKITNAFRYLTKDKEGRIFYAGTDQFGYIKVSPSGVAQLVSLHHVIPEEYLPLGANLTLQRSGHYLYLQSKLFLFRLELSKDMELKSFKSWKAETSYTYTFLQGENLFIHQSEKGLYRLDGEEIRQLPETELLGRERLQIMLPFATADCKGECYLLGNFNSGLYVYDGQRLKKFQSQIDSYLQKGALLYAGVQLDNGNYALSVIGFGVFVINSQGDIVKNINQEKGLPSNAILNLTIDNSESLWILCDEGIARVLINSNSLFFGEDMGITSKVVTIEKIDDIVYLGTTTGLLRFDPDEGIFKLIPELPKGQIFNLVRDGDDLIIPQNELLILRNGKVIPIATEEMRGRPIQSLVAIDDPNVLYVASTMGIAVFSRGDSPEIPWIYKGQIEGIEKDLRLLAVANDGALWAGGAARVLLKITKRDPKGSLTDLKNYDFKTYEMLNIGSGLKAVNGEIYYASANELYKYSTIRDSFEKISLFDADNESELNFIQEDSRGRIWGSSSGGSLMIININSDNSFTIEETPRINFPIVTSDKILFDADSIGWFSYVKKGLVRFDGRFKNSEKVTPFVTLIRKMETKSDTLALHRYGRIAETRIKKLKENSLRFDFAAPYFDQEKEIMYQTYLEGFDKDWVDWNNSKFKEYTNLSPGNFTFRVRAKNVYSQISDEATFRFSILPPWYATWWAYVAYVSLALFVIYFISKFQSDRLVAKQISRTKEKELAQAKEIERAYYKLAESHNHLKATQSQLIQAEKMASLGELTAGIAHEIQNPLNFVNNFAELSSELMDEMNEELERGDIDEAKAISTDIKQNLEKINHHGKRADSIVKGMLEHSRARSGTKEPVDINALVDEYLRLSYHGLRAKDKSFNADIKTDFDKSLLKVNVIPQDIGRVLLNLFNNAFYAVNEARQNNSDEYNPTVSLTTKKVEDKIEIRVSDNGNGIPENIVDKIFQPFFTTKPTGQGTGLGLSLSYDIVKAHGGTISVESVAGSGTTFTVSIPE